MDSLPSIQDAALAEEPLAALDTAGPGRDLRPLGATAPGCAGIVTVEKLLLF